LTAVQSDGMSEINCSSLLV